MPGFVLRKNIDLVISPAGTSTNQYLLTKGVTSLGERGEYDAFQNRQFECLAVA